MCRPWLVPYSFKSSQDRHASKLLTAWEYFGLFIILENIDTNSRYSVEYIIYRAHRPRIREGKMRSESYLIPPQAFIDTDICGYAVFRTLQASSSLVSAQSGAEKSWGKWAGQRCKGLGMVGEVLVMSSVSSEMRIGRRWRGWRGVCGRCRGWLSISNEEVKKCVCNIFERMFMGI